MRTSLTLFLFHMQFRGLLKGQLAKGMNLWLGLAFLGPTVSHCSLEESELGGGGREQTHPRVALAYEWTEMIPCGQC